MKTPCLQRGAKFLKVPLFKGDLGGSAGVRSHTKKFSNNLLTYQKIGETEKSHTNFNEAIRLFNEMEAPKQVEKVEKAKRGNVDS